MNGLHRGTRHGMPGERLRGLAVALLLAAVPMLGACAEESPEPDIDVEQPGSAEPTAASLGEIGGRIYNEPARAEEILEDAGLTSEEFEARVREITDDPMLSREYTLAFEEVVEALDAETADGTEGDRPPAGAPPGT